MQKTQILDRVSYVIHIFICLSRENTEHIHKASDSATYEK